VAPQQPEQRQNLKAIADAAGPLSTGNQLSVT